MRISPIKLLCFALLSLMQSLHASPSSNDFWGGFFNQATLNETFSWWNELQLRHDLDNSRLQQTLLRTGLLVNLNHAGEGGVLYAYIKTSRYQEHRLALQHIITYGNTLNFIMTQRMRLEYRMLEHYPNLPERFRFALRGQALTENPLKPVWWDEVFINLRKDHQINNRIFGINRVFLGAKYQMTPQANIEFGYLNQLINRPKRNFVEHIFALYLFFRT